MNKCIVLLSGTPSGKKTFQKLAQENAWVWNVNPKDNLIDKLKIIWDGEKNEKFFKSVQKLLDLMNQEFDFERNYLSEKINKFNGDTDEVKVSGDVSFRNFILVAHGVSKNLVNYLQEEFGVFKIHIAEKDSKVNIENHDFVFYEDDENLAEKINKTLKVLVRGDNNEQ